MAGLSDKKISKLLNTSIEEYVDTKIPKATRAPNIISLKRRENYKFNYEYTSPVIKKEEIKIDPKLEEIPGFIKQGFKIIYTKDYFTINKESIKEIDKGINPFLYKS